MMSNSLTIDFSSVSFSILMSVYFFEKTSNLDLALDSILNNSIQAAEVILVEDGPLNDELYDVVEKYRLLLNIKTVKIEKNIGLGRALNLGLESCSNDLVARCDTDDINRPYRFEMQMAQFIQTPQLGILSGWVEEFSTVPGDSGVVRKVPESTLLVRYAKSRSPFNHPCVMFRKSAVIAAGGYQDDYLYEDYALWVRMICAGAVADNIQNVLVDMRGGQDMHKRRSGLKYAISESYAQIKFYKIGFLTFSQLLKNLMIRIPVRLVPAKLTSFIYYKVLR